MNKEISEQQLLATLKRLERLSYLSDSRFRVPFTNIRFGLDAIIGLIPFVGDCISLVISLYLLFEASKLGTPHSLKLKMLRNVVLDWLIGLVPILGDAADVFIKANNKNMKLLVEHIDQDYKSRQSLNDEETKPKVSRYMLIILVALLTALSFYVITIYSQQLV